MAKFNVGDRVRDKKYPKSVMTIVRVGQDIHGPTYFTRFDDYSTPSQTYYESDLLSANASANPVVANAIAWKNAVACNDNPKYASLERELLSAIRGGNEAKLKSLDSKIRGMECEWIAQKSNGLLVDNINWIVNDIKRDGNDVYTAVRITDNGKLWNSKVCNNKYEYGKSKLKPCEVRDSLGNVLRVGDNVAEVQGKKGTVVDLGMWVGSPSVVIRTDGGIIMKTHNWVTKGDKFVKNSAPVATNAFVFGDPDGELSIGESSYRNFARIFKSMETADIDNKNTPRRHEVLKNLVGAIRKATSDLTSIR